MAPALVPSAITVFQAIVPPDATVTVPAPLSLKLRGPVLLTLGLNVTVPEVALFVNDQPESNVKIGEPETLLPIVVVFVRLKLFAKVTLSAPRLAPICMIDGIRTMELSNVKVSPETGIPSGLQLIPEAVVQLSPAPVLPPSHTFATVGAFGTNPPPEECTNGDPIPNANEERSSLRASVTIGLVADVLFESEVADNRSVLLAGERPKSASAPPKKMSLSKIPHSLPKVERSNGFASA
jgi:hypothetical protein